MFDYSIASRVNIFIHEIFPLYLAGNSKPRTEGYKRGQYLSVLFEPLHIMTQSFDSEKSLRLARKDSSSGEQLSPNDLTASGWNLFRRPCANVNCWLLSSCCMT